MGLWTVERQQFLFLELYHGKKSISLFFVSLFSFFIGGEHLCGNIFIFSSCCTRRTVTKQRLVKIVTRGNSGRNNIVLEENATIDHHEYITAFDEPNAVIATDDDDGGDSITYIEDYEIAGNSDDADGDAFFVEYVTEDEDNLAMQSAAVSGDSNDSDDQQQQLEQVVDYDDDGADTDEMYNCSTCGMNFRSVTEHIEKHHPEQDVLIDISDEGGATAIKTERALDLNDDNDIDNSGGYGDSDTYITTGHTIGMMDGELVVCGTGEDELLDDNDSELIEDSQDENNDDDVYSYDEATGQLTRTTFRKPSVTKLVTTNKTTVNMPIIVLVWILNGEFNRNFHSETDADATETGQTFGTKRQIQNAKRFTCDERPCVWDLQYDILFSQKFEVSCGALARKCVACRMQVPLDWVSYLSLSSSFLFCRLHARMHLPVKSKTMDEACDMDTDAAIGGEQEQPRKKFYCAICGKHYDDKFQVVHMQMHDGAEKFNCAICNKVFPNKESLKMHSKAHQDPRNVSAVPTTTISESFS